MNLVALPDSQNWNCCS